mgnify:CR=1 FL=1
MHAAVRVFTVLVFGMASVLGMAAPATAQDGETQRAVRVTGARSGIGLKVTEVLAANG